MIDLNTKVKAREDKGFDLTPAPEGDYVLRVKKIDDWKANNPATIMVIQRDSSGKALKDDKGKNITVKEDNVIVYNCKVQLEIIEGEHKGKIIFHNLTTHPNAPFNIPGFLYGLDMKELMASEIQKECLGKLCAAKVIIEEYDKKVEDKETGLTTTVKTPINRVGNFKQLVGYKEEPTSKSEFEGI